MVDKVTWTAQMSPLSPSKSTPPALDPIDDAEFKGILPVSKDSRAWMAASLATLSSRSVTVRGMDSSDPVGKAALRAEVLVRS